MSGGLRWYCARAKSGQEALAIINLARQEFQAYTPKQTVERWRGSKIVNESELVFPGYLLINFDIEADGWKAINSTKGVIRLLGNNETGIPSPLPIGEIESLQEREAAGLLRVSEVKRVRPGDKVKVEIGYLAGRIGVVSWTKSERVAFLLNLLGRQSVVIAPRHALSVMAKV